MIKRTPGTWWYFIAGKNINYFIGLDDIGTEVWRCDNGKLAAYSSEKGYEIYDCTGFDHEFKIPDVPDNNYQHQTPPVFREVVKEDAAWLSAESSIPVMSNFRQYDASMGGGPKRWILEEVPQLTADDDVIVYDEDHPGYTKPRTVEVGLIVVLDAHTNEVRYVTGPDHTKHLDTEYLKFRWLGPKTTHPIKEE